MCRFIETICLEAGEARHLSRHDFRMNATCKEFFGNVPDVQLKDYIVPPQTDRGRIRCRVTYAQDILDIEYFPYRIGPVHTLKLIEGSTTDYRYKYADRSALEPCLRSEGKQMIY